MAFIDDEEEKEEDVEGEVKKGEEAAIVEIVVKNLIEKFPNDIVLLKEVINILKLSAHIDPEKTLNKVKEAYKSLKEENPKALIELYSRQEMTLELLVKGSKRVEKSEDSDAKNGLRKYLIKKAIDLLTKSETD